MVALYDGLIFFGNKKKLKSKPKSYGFYYQVGPVILSEHNSLLFYEKKSTVKAKVVYSTRINRN